MATNAAYDFAPVIQHLKRERAELDLVIAKLEAMSSAGQAAVLPNQPTIASEAQPSEVKQPAGSRGNGFATAAIAVMADHGKPMTSKEIVAALEAKGLHMNSANPPNALNATLNRRMKQIGDVYRPESGKWGLSGFNLPNEDLGETP